jgi:hypothetical protein
MEQRFWVAATLLADRLCFPLESLQFLLQLAELNRVRRIPDRVASLGGMILVNIAELF